MMKKRLVYVLIVVFIVASYFVITAPVTSKMGVNYNVREIKIPLYLKILDFLDRHYNFAYLAKDIVDGAKTDEERAMRILEWTHKNIRKHPADMPIIDHHIWNVIVKGYGTPDQSCAVMATICDYAGLPAYYTLDTKRPAEKILALTYVKIDGKTSVFEPARGIYFVKDNGSLAEADELKNGGGWKVATLSPQETTIPEDLPEYAASMKNRGIHEGNVQSPVNRLLAAIGLMR